MKVVHLQAYQAVKVGAEYITSFTPKHYDITFEQTIQCWKIVHRESGRIVMVSMYNVPWFEIEEEKNDTSRSDAIDGIHAGQGSGGVRVGEPQGEVFSKPAKPTSRGNKS